MNNCYCGHPEKSHSRKHRVNYFDDNIHGNGTRYLSVFSHACYNCICLKFIEKAESQEPKALEERPCVCGDDKIDGYWHSKDGCEPLVVNPREEPKCPECHYPKGEPHSRRCSMRRDGLVGETEPKEEMVEVYLEWGKFPDRKRQFMHGEFSKEKVERALQFIKSQE